MAKKTKKVEKEFKNTTPQKAYIKHLVECKCVLLQYKNLDPVPYHKFIVFSELEEVTAMVKPSFAQCPNCGAVHRVTEIGQSEITAKDNSRAVPTIDDIEMELPNKMIKLLQRHDCDLPTWQEAKFIIENQLWGSSMIISKEHESETVVGKIVTILNREIYKLETFERFEGLI